MIRCFTCRNFRNVGAENLEFCRINILIGPNNSGKSNFIKAMMLMSSMTGKDGISGLGSSFLNMVASNGWSRMFNDLCDGERKIELSWLFDVPALADKPLKYSYEFLVGDRPEDCIVTKEDLSTEGEIGKGHHAEYNFFRCHGDLGQGRGEFSTATREGYLNKRVRFQLNSQETLLAQYKDVLLENSRLYNETSIRRNVPDLLSGLVDEFHSMHAYRSSDFILDRIIHPVLARNSDQVLVADGSNLVNVLNNIKALDLAKRDVFKTRLQEMIHGLDDVDVSFTYDRLVLRLSIHGRQYDLEDVSDGTVKAMLMDYLVNIQSDSMLAIDEPEVNLHPAWLKVLGQWIVGDRSQRQFFISTHSPDLLDAFTEGFRNGAVKLFIFDCDGPVPIRPVTFGDISGELGDWELGDLYRTNDPALGGWPW